MKYVILALGFIYFFIQSDAQIVYSNPSTPVWTEQMTLYIDVNLSTGMTGSLKEMLIAHPESVNDVYVWIWQPSDPVAGNGNWSSSNEALKMTWVSDLLFSISFIPYQFFDCGIQEFHDYGISCLAKLKNGNAYSVEFESEAKTEDLYLETVTSVAHVVDQSGDELMLYPNPASSVVFVNSLNDFRVEQIRVMDHASHVVIDSTSFNHNSNALDISGLAAGIYLVEVNSAQRRILKKLIVIPN